MKKLAIVTAFTTAMIHNGPVKAEPDFCAANLTSDVTQLAKDYEDALSRVTPPLSEAPGAAMSLILGQAAIQSVCKVARQGGFDGVAACLTTLLTEENRAETMGIELDPNGNLAKRLDQQLVRYDNILAQSCDI